MAKSNKAKFDEIQKRMDKAWRQATSKEETIKYAEFVTKDVVKRTRLGYGVNEDGQAKIKLKALQSETKENRKLLRKLGALSTLTTPSKSNLTMTGQLLDSVSFDAKVKSFKMFIKDNRSFFLIKKKRASLSGIIEGQEQLRENEGLKKKRLSKKDRERLANNFLLNSKNTTNEKVAIAQANQGRKFLFISNLESKRLRNLIKQTYLNYLRNQLK